MEIVEYISRHAELGLRLRSAKRTFDGGKWTFIPGLRVQFSHGRLRVRDPKIVKALDGMLNGPKSGKWRNWFTKVPSQKEMAEVSEAVKKGIEVKRSVIDELPKEKKEQYAEFDRFMEKEKDNPAAKNIVAGMRSIGK